MTKQKLRILIVDDHPMVRRGLAATIELEPDMEVAGTAASGIEAVAMFRDLKPDVTIMDLTLRPEMSGIQAIQAIRRETPGAKIVVLSASVGDEDIFQAIHSGAITYLLKGNLSDDLIPILREVYAGGGAIPPEVARKLADRLSQPTLTTREINVLQLMAQGLRNKEIAAQLGITDQTTQGHVKNILAKLNVHDRTGAVTIALRRGIIHMQ
jgi:DNA-binding NarL/FixJ family response regulator